MTGWVDVVDDGGTVGVAAEVTDPLVRFLKAGGIADVGGPAPTLEIISKEEGWGK